MSFLAFRLLQGRKQVARLASDLDSSKRTRLEAALREIAVRLIAGESDGAA